jgi:hypothetical protein
MISTSYSYPSAREIADRVRVHFVGHVSGATSRGVPGVAAAPDAETIATMLDAAFWASLRREEGATPVVSLAFVPPERAGQTLTFERPLELDPTSLARLAPAVERPGIHLGVWDSGAGLRVWGTTRSLPPFCFVIEVVASGLLVIKHRSETFGKFVNVAVLEGDQVKIVDESRAGVPDCPGLVASLLGVESRSGPAGRVNVLVQVAASMRAHRRGGILLVVPDESRVWQDSIVNPVLYSIDPPFVGLTDLIRQDSQAESHEWQDDFRRAVDAVAGLTAVDGATVVSQHYAVLAFGAKITRRRGNPPVERVLVSEPVEGGELLTVTPTQLGGTRHLSAAQFVQDQRDALALVASQDGRFTIFSWSACEDAVHAHRVEALLL